MSTTGDAGHPADVPLHQGDADVGDRMALRALVEAYAFSVDQRDAAWFTSLFTPDGRLTGHKGAAPAHSDFQGREALATIIEAITRFERTLHLVANHRCVVTGDTATGETYSVAHHISPGEHGGHEDYVMTIRYVDRYQRDASGTWRIERRKCHTQWVERTNVRAYLAEPG